MSSKDFTAVWQKSITNLKPSPVEASNWVPAVGCPKCCLLTFWSPIYETGSLFLHAVFTIGAINNIKKTKKERERKLESPKHYLLLQ